MPNWTSNTLKAPVEVLKKYISKDEDGDDRFDFNLVIPRPEIYEDPDLVSGGHEPAAINWYLSEKGTKELAKTEKSKNDRSFGAMIEHILFSSLEFDSDPSAIQRWGDPDKLYEIGRKYVEAHEKYGHYDWYSWSYANWGTKWNACDSYVDLDGGTIDFETAWNYPKPVIEKLLADNPNCRIEYWWSDEDYNGDHWIIREADGSVSEGIEYNESHYDEEDDDE